MTSSNPSGTWDESAGPPQPAPGTEGHTYTPADFPFGGYPGQPAFPPPLPEQRFGGPHAVGGPALVGAAPATMGNRLLAKLIDGLIVGLPFGLLYVWADNAGNGDAETAISLAAAVATMVYETLFISRRGTTIGKQARGIQVLDERSGQRLTPGKAFQRSFVQYITNYLLLAGCWSPLLDRPRLRGWHDKVAGDVVVVGPPGGRG